MRPAGADPVVGRRGFDLNAPYRSYFPDADGTIVVQAEELDRVELLVGATSGSLRTPQGVRVVLNPKGSARVGSQVVIDLPRPDTLVPRQRLRPDRRRSAAGHV